MPESQRSRLHIVVTKLKQIRSRASNPLPIAARDAQERARGAARNEEKATT
jgi:hypothetical protein